MNAMICLFDGDLHWIGLGKGDCSVLSKRTTVLVGFFVVVGSGV